MSLTNTRVCVGSRRRGMKVEFTPPLTVLVLQALSLAGWSITSAMWFVYILKSKIKEKYYVGCTNNLRKRIYQHNTGQTLSVKAYLPYELVYKEEYREQSVAYKREKEIKSYKGGRAFKKLIKE